MSEIASAFVTLVPSARGFGRRTESQLGGEVNAAGKFLGVGFGKVFAGVAAVGAAVGFTKILTSSIGAFKDLSLETLRFQRITGGTVQEASRLQFAIHDSGADVEKATSAITIFSKKLGTAAPDVKKTAALTKLMGVNFLKANGQIIPMGKLLPKVADQFAKMPNGVNKTALATQLFGRAGTQMLPFLNKGSAAIAEMMDKSDKLGLTMTQKGLNAFLKYRAASRELGDTFEGLKVSIGQRLLPVITRFIHTLTNTVTPAIQSFMDWLAHSQGVKEFLARLKDAITFVGTTVGSVIGALAPVAAKVAGFIDKTVLPALGRLLRKVGPVVDKIKTFFTTGAGSTALQTALDTVHTTATKIKGSFEKAATALGTMKDKASGFSLGSIDAKALGKSLGTALITALSTLVQSATQINDQFTKLFGTIDWIGIGITIGRQLPALLIGLAAGIINLDWGGLFKGLGDHWVEILLAVLAVAFAPSKFVGPLERILTRIPFVGRFLAAAVVWLSELGSKLTGFGADLFRSFTRGFGSLRFPGAGILAKVMGALRAIPGSVKNFVDLLGVRLGVWALDAFEALGRGARGAVGRLVSFVGTIGGRVLRGVGKLGGLLKPVGEAIVNGLKDGISGAWHFVTEKIDALIRKIPAPVRKFLGIKSPSTLFREIGTQVVAGLALGVSNTAPVDAAVARLAAGVNVAAPHLSPTAVGSATGGHSVALEQALYRATSRALSESGAVIMSKDNLRDLDLLVGAA